MSDLHKNDPDSPYADDLEFVRDYARRNDGYSLVQPVVDFINAHAPATATALSEELRKVAADYNRDGYPEPDETFCHLAARAEQLEHDLAEARAEVERFVGHLHTAEHNHAFAAEKWTQMEKERDEAQSELAEVTNARDSLREAYDHARAEVERLTEERDRIASGRDVTCAEVDGKPAQKGAESNAETPNPADVKEEEPYHIYYGVYGNDHTIGVRIDGKWRCIGDDRGVHVTDTNIASLTRLVPAPRVITNPDELDRLAATSIISDGRGWPGGVTEQGVIMVNGLCVSDEEVLGHGPVTVLWEPAI